MNYDQKRTLRNNNISLYRQGKSLFFESYPETNNPTIKSLLILINSGKLHLYMP